MVRSEEQMVEVPRAVETACGDSINQQLLGKNIFRFLVVASAVSAERLSWAKTLGRRRTASPARPFVMSSEAETSLTILLKKHAAEGPLLSTKHPREM